MKSTFLLQVSVALVVVLVSLLFGRTASLAAAAGALTVLVPNLFFAFYLNVFKPSAIRLFVGEALKLSIMVCVFVLISYKYDFLIHAPTYWVALVVVVKSHGLSVLRTAK